MEEKNPRTKFSAASITAAVFGVLAGLGGITHAIGEIRQGNVAPEGLIIILAALWPWVFAFSVIYGVFLVIGSVVLVYFTGLNNPDLFTNSFFLVVLSQLFLIFAGRAYDARKVRQLIAV